MNERYGDDSSTRQDLDPDLWLEARSFRPDRNQGYSISNTTTEDLRTNHSVSTIGYSQLVLSTQTPEFEMVLNQRVEAHAAHIAAQTKRLTVEMLDLRRLYIELKSQIGGTCAPPDWSHGPNEDLLPPFPPASILN